MKILHVIPSVSPLRGGPSHAVFDMCRGLTQEGVDVTLLTTDDNGASRLNVPLGKPIFQEGYTILYFPRNTSLYTISWSIVIWLNKHIQEYDFVHIHAVFSFVSILSAFMARQKGIPYAIRPCGILMAWGLHARRHFAKQLSIRLLEKPLLNCATFIHVTSNQEAIDLRNLGIRSSIEVIYLGIDSALLIEPSQNSHVEQERDPDGNIMFLFMSRFHPVKGLDLLLPAFAAVMKKIPNVILLLAGDGSDDYKAWLQATIRELGIEGQVIWLGFLMAEEKLQALRRCDVFVLPSYSENFGVAVVEAMAAGKSIIISDQIAIHDVIKTAEAGEIVSCSVDSLSAAMTKLALDSEMRMKFGQQAKILVEQEFTSQKMIDHLLIKYNQEITAQKR